MPKKCVKDKLEMFVSRVPSVAWMSHRSNSVLRMSTLLQALMVVAGVPRYAASNVSKNLPVKELKQLA